MEFKAEIKKTFTGPDKLRAVCSVVLDDCFLVKNVRVVEGETGLFVCLPRLVRSTIFPAMCRPALCRGGGTHAP